MRVIFNDGSIADLANVRKIYIDEESVEFEVSKNPDESQEADEYVRDLLLIQWMMERYYDGLVDVEDVYDDWINWLKGKEAEHAERSKV